MIEKFRKASSKRLIAYIKVATTILNSRGIQVQTLNAKKDHVRV